MFNKSEASSQFTAGDSDPRASLPLLSPRSRRLLWTSFALGLVGMLTGLVIALVRWNFAYSHYGPAVVWQWAATPSYAALLCAIVSFVALFNFLRRRQQVAVAHLEGLTLQLRRKRVHYPWQQLCDLSLNVVHYGLPFWKWSSQFTATLSTNSNQKLTFRGSAQALDAFSNTIKHYLYPLRLQDYRQTLERDETIAFGPLQCAKDGLTYRNELYRWDSVRAASLQSGQLVISVQSATGPKSVRIPAKRIPNPDLCAQLINRIEY